MGVGGDVLLWLDNGVLVAVGGGERGEAAPQAGHAEFTRVLGPLTPICNPDPRASPPCPLLYPLRHAHHHGHGQAIVEASVVVPKRTAAAGIALHQGERAIQSPPYSNG
jgi:hypothetical protein